MPTLHFTPAARVAALAALAALPLGAPRIDLPAARGNLIIQVRLTGGPHAGSYSGTSGASCVSTPEGLVTGYMPAVVDAGLRSFRLVLRRESAQGSNDFALNFALARRNVVYASFALDPANGTGTGSARATRAQGRATIDISGRTADGVQLAVTVKCDAEGDGPTVADAAAATEEEPAAKEAASPEDDSTWVPSAVVDMNAQTFADRISLGGATGAGALREAIQWAGFGIRDAQGKVILRPGVGDRGIDFDAGDVARLERQGGSELRVPLGNVTAGLAKLSPGLTGAALARTIVDDLRAAAASDARTTRFWARFIAARGGDVAARFAGPPDSLKLDPIALAFLMRQMEADFALAAAKAGGTRRTGMLPPARSLELARRTSGPSADVDEHPALAIECKLSDTQSTTLDYTAMGNGVLGGLIQKVLSSEVAARVAKMTGVANFAFAYAKLLTTLNTLKVETGIDGTNAFVRTKSTTENGESVRVKTEVTLPPNPGGSVLNCLRPLFNQAGLDFSIAEGGPVKDASVEYQIVSGGTRVFGTASGRPELNIVEFSPGTNPTKGNITNDAGETTIGLTGVRQRNTLPPTARMIEREIGLRVNVQLTRPSLVKDIPSVVGTAAAGTLAPIAAIPELMARIAWPVNTAKIPMKDWSDGLTYSLVRSPVEFGDDSCQEGVGVGRDMIDGSIAKDSSQGDFIRQTNAPACGGRGIWIKCPYKNSSACKGGRMWDGDEKGCVLRLDGTQHVRLTRSTEHSAEHGEVVKLRWRLARGASMANVVGDCLNSRFGLEVPPDDEFIVTTKEEVVALYNGYAIAKTDPTPRWVGYTDGATFRAADVKRGGTIESIEREEVASGVTRPRWVLRVQ